jgi:hypothetical protein
MTDLDLARSRRKGATDAPLPRRAPGPPGRFDAPRPTADKGRRNIQPQGQQLATPADLFSKSVIMVCRAAGTKPRRHTPRR